jgi:hypothetical protein
VAQPESSQAVKVGILLARRPVDLGEWLADGAAFDAAGAGALWIDLVPDLDLDPLILTAGLAAVTYRSVLVLVLPVSGEPDPARGRALDTVARLSHGRLRVLARDASDPQESDPQESDPQESEPQKSEPAGSDLDGYELDEAELWTSAPPPDSRATWRTALVDAFQGGFRGLLVPADPRLIDILRNPDDPGTRPDLQLAQG